MNRITYYLERARLALLATLNPWRAVRLLRDENERLAKTIAEPLLTGIRIGNGTLDIGMKGGHATQLMAGMFLGMFERYPDAHNYIECTFGSPQGPILVTVQKPGGKTPHLLRMEAEQQAHRLREAIEAIEVACQMSPYRDHGAWDSALASLIAHHARLLPGRPT